MKLLTFLSVFTLGLGVTLCASSLAQEKHEPGTHQHPKAATLTNPVKATEASIAKGKDLFAKQCATCHGPMADGDSLAGKALNPPASNLTDAKWKHGGSDGEIFMTITKGAPGTGMVSFEKDLSVRDCWDLVNYIKSLGPPKGEVKK